MTQFMLEAWHSWQSATWHPLPMPDAAGTRELGSMMQASPTVKHTADNRTDMSDLDRRWKSAKRQTAVRLTSPQISCPDAQVCQLAVSIIGALPAPTGAAT